MMRSDCFLHWITQLRVWHWETVSYATHIAMGSAYDTFTELTDKYVEVYQGKNKRLPLPTFEHCPTYVDMEYVKDKIRWFKEYLILELCKELDDKVDSDLLNLRDEMLGELNKLSYLLTLS